MTLAGGSAALGKVSLVPHLPGSRSPPLPLPRLLGVEASLPTELKPASAKQLVNLAAYCVTVVGPSETTFRVQELCEGRGGRPGLPVPDSPYGL